MKEYKYEAKIDYGVDYGYMSKPLFVPKITYSWWEDSILPVPLAMIAGFTAFFTVLHFYPTILGLILAVGALFVVGRLAIDIICST